MVIALFAILPSLLTAQTQKPSIQTGVTFQWADIQIDKKDPATIQSITINGIVYSTFVVPTSYELTRVGPDGHDKNKIKENGVHVIKRSDDKDDVDGDGPADDDETSTLWNTMALSSFQDKNLNHFFDSSKNGQNICLDFNAIATTDAQKQSIFYSPLIPSNEGGVLAITERNINNCYHIAIYGIPPLGGLDQLLGETFVRPNSGTLSNPYFPPNQEPNPNTDYWKSERVVDNNGTIGIALFYLSDIVGTGSKISRIEFNASTKDHGDGKIFLVQKYAVDQQNMGCLDDTYNGNANASNNVPNNSIYTLISGICRIYTHYKSTEL